eukprot:scaffold191783_cov25-Tisochrysis_lutea.AAC.3
MDGRPGGRGWAAARRGRRRPWAAWEVPCRHCSGDGRRARRARIPRTVGSGGRTLHPACGLVKRSGRKALGAGGGGVVAFEERELCRRLGGRLARAIKLQLTRSTATR